MTPPRKRPDARAILYERIRSTPAKFVHVCGVPYAVEPMTVEEGTEPTAVWLTLEVPPFGRVRVVVNTGSLLGPDARVRVGVVQTTWDAKPDIGLIESDGMNYRAVESLQPVVYEEREAAALNEELVRKGRAAVRAEVWGDLYARDHVGIHQVHCRRASQALPADLVGRDGALKLYYTEENAAELFLFKFAGQA